MDSPKIITYENLITLESMKMRYVHASSFKEEIVEEIEEILKQENIIQTRVQLNKVKSKVIV